MKSAMRTAAVGMRLGATIILAVSALVLPTRGAAQTDGYNAVYNSSGSCCAASPAFIDASMYVSKTYPNICAVLNHLLSKVVTPGAVIDARGISGAAALTCTAGCPRFAPRFWASTWV
jgi:hypothetical protein